MRDECRARQALVTEYLMTYHIQTNQEGFHVWVPISAGWSAVDLASYLRSEGVAAVASAAFSTDGSPPEAVRICLGGPINRKTCELSLRILADSLEHPHHPQVSL